MIFISYSHKNNDAAAQVKKQMEAEGYVCFLAHDDVGGGKDWHDEIWKTLHDSHAFLGLVTEEFNASAFCQQELGAALALNKARLLVLLDGKPAPGFASRFQAVKESKLSSSIGNSSEFRQLRVETWIEATASAGNFLQANSLYKRFGDEWESMDVDEQLRWLLAAASNGQVRGEDYHVGPFFTRKRKELEPSNPKGSLLISRTGTGKADTETAPTGSQRRSFVSMTFLFTRTILPAATGGGAFAALSG